MTCSRPSRVPDTETVERRQARIEREEILAEQRAFLADFDRQVTELEAKAAAAKAKHPGGNDV